MLASDKEIINRVESLAKKRGASMAAVATAWTLHKDVVSAPIVGLNSEDRIKDMVVAVNLKLTDEELKYLEEPYVAKPVVAIS